ncbi:MAG TPA: hypothetical protein VJ489_04390 [Thermoplasmata archaeon]|nr:hypothetical protein [Thermoplasmata archaeon]
MEPELLEILKDALKLQQRKESFESALGRAVRDRGRDFPVYVQMISELRELAHSMNQDVESAVRALLSEGEKQA